MKISKEDFEKNVLSGTILNFESSWNNKPILFEIMPKKYLQFAEESLNMEKNENNLINALSNTKRALDAQVELMIFEHGFRKILKKERWKFPRKVQFLKDNFILAPRILEKINRARNTVEHDFKKPNSENVEDFFDIVTLFIGYSEKLRRVPDLIKLGFDESSNESFTVEFNKIDLKFDVIFELNKLFSITEDDISHSRLLRLFYGLQPANWTLVHRSELQDKSY